MESRRVHGIDAWQQVARSVFLPVRCTGAGREFSASLELRDLAQGLRVSRLKIGAHEVERSRAMVAADARDHLIVILQMQESWIASQGGRGAPVAPGDVVILDAAAPYRMSLPTRGQDMVILELNRGLVELSEGMIRRLVARTIDAGVPGQAVLSSLMVSLQGPQLALDARAGRELASVVADTVAMVARSLARRETATPLDGHTALEKLRQWLRVHAQDAAVTVERLAAEHFMSVRQVHALFAAEGDRPAAYLRRVRLERATELLELGEASGLTVREIAAESGYSDSAAFIRAFTKAYGRSPTKWRVSRETAGDAAGSGVAAERVPELAP